MAKVEIEMELTGFKLKIKADQAAIPVIADNLSEQLGNMISPATGIASGEAPKKKVQNEAPPLFAAPKPKKKRSRSKASNKSSGNSNGGSSQGDEAGANSAIDWRHDPESWGSPQQEWTVINKLVWLLYVVKQNTDFSEVPAAIMVNTFNKHFKEAGTLHPPLVSRELSKAKKLSPSPVGEDTTKDPSLWYLTNEGNTLATGIIAEARGAGN